MASAGTLRVKHAGLEIAMTGITGHARKMVIQRESDESAITTVRQALVEGDHPSGRYRAAALIPA